MNEYEQLQSRLARGWNTWNTHSVLSHVHLPDGFALNLGFKQFKETECLRSALIARTEQRDAQVRPGRRAYDGTYTDLTVNWKGLEVRLQTATDGDDLVILATLLSPHKKAPLLIVETGILWNRPGHIEHEGSTIAGHFPDVKWVVFGTKPSVPDPGIPANTPYLALPMDTPVGVSTGKARSLTEIMAIIEKRQWEQDERITAFGNLAEPYEAMQCCLAWNTIYDPSKERVISPVSRLVNVIKNGYILFCWDAYFAAYMAGVDNRDLAYANAIEMTRERTPAGFVPNYAQTDGFASFDRSEPPVGALVARELYRRFGDRWFLEEIFEGLLEWNRWWHQARAVDNLLAWGSTPYEPIADQYWENAGVNDTFGGALESGLDNSPLYDDIPFDHDRHVMKLVDVGLNGLYVLDCRCLSDIAHILGRETEAAELTSRATAYADALKTLWSEKAGIFLNRRTDTGEFSPRLAPTCFYPFLADVVSEEQAERMVQEHFYNPEEFWGDWIMPSIARNDPAYPDQNYWRGRIWPPMNFLAYLGLRHSTQNQARSDLAEKSLNLLLNGWRAHRHVCENYSGDTGYGGEEKQSSDRFYHWGGLLGLIAFLEEGVIPGPEQPLE